MVAVIGVVAGALVVWVAWSLLWDLLRFAGPLVLIAAMIAWVPVHFLFRLLGYRGGDV